MRSVSVLSVLKSIVVEISAGNCVGTTMRWRDTTQSRGVVLGAVLGVGRLPSCKLPVFCRQLPSSIFRPAAASSFVLLKVNRPKILIPPYIVTALVNVGP